PVFSATGAIRFIDDGLLLDGVGVLDDGTSDVTIAMFADIEEDQSIGGPGSLAVGDASLGETMTSSTLTGFEYTSDPMGLDTLDFAFADLSGSADTMDLFPNGTAVLRVTGEFGDDPFAGGRFGQAGVSLDVFATAVIPLPPAILGLLGSLVILAGVRRRRG
ncbi:MAG: hypothetical protein AAF281_08010, partial [Pseudomonadota bacterium]